MGIVQQLPGYQLISQVDHHTSGIAHPRVSLVKFRQAFSKVAPSLQSRTICSAVASGLITGKRGGLFGDSMTVVMIKE
jgi:hypothetical protein